MFTLPESLVKYPGATICRW